VIGFVEMRGLRVMRQELHRLVLQSALQDSHCSIHSRPYKLYIGDRQVYEYMIVL